MKVFGLRFTALLVVMFCGTSASAQVTDTAASPLVTKVESQIEASDFESAIQSITDAQKNGQDSLELAKLLVTAYGGRIEQVGMLSKRSIAKKIREAMEHVVALAPDDIGAQVDLANFHVMAPGMIGGDKDIARQLIDAISLKDPLQGHVLNGNLAAANKDTDLAFSFYEKALTLDPGSADALLAKGLLLVEQKSHSEAIDALHQCTIAHPDNMECTYQLGKTSQTANIELEKGVVAFTRFVNHSNYDKDYIAHAHLRLGNIYAQRNEIEKARTEYEMAIEVNNLKKAHKALKKLN